MNAWTGDVKATVDTFSVHPVEYSWNSDHERVDW